jgi:hypothetical protein
MLASDTTRPNLLQNGGFEQWHRGLGPFAASTAGPYLLTADQWATICTGTGSTITVTRDATNKDSGLYCAACQNSIAGGGGYAGIYQAPSVFSLRGKIIYLSMRIRSVESSTQAYIYTDGTGGSTQLSTAHPADNTYHTLTVSYTVPVDANILNVGFQCQGSNAGTIYVDGAYLVIGQVSETFFPAISYPDALPNERVASDLSRPNYLTNGGFEIWQRGTGPFTSNYCADRWIMGINGTDAMSVSRATSGNADYAVTGSNYSAGVTYTRGSGNSSALLQYLKQADAYQLSGRTVTLSMRVQSSTPNMVRVGLDSDVVGSGSAASPRSLYHPGDGTWQTLSVTLSLGACSYVAASAYFDTNSGIAYIDSATLTIGTIAPDFVPLHPADDLARCKRYYNWTGNVNDGSVAVQAWAGYAGAQWIHMGFFPAEMAVVPTITKVGIWAVSNCGQPALWGSIRAWGVNVSSSAVGQYAFSCGAVGQMATFEANP